MQTFNRNARSESLRENSEQNDANDYAFCDADERVEAFLDVYRRLEKALKSNRRYAQNNPYDNVIIRFSNSNEGKAYKESLDLIREIRNLLTHSPKVAGDYPVEPSPALYRILKEVLEIVKNPELAVNYAIRADQVFKTSLHENALNVMRKMESAGFSHVPVVIRDELLGVFSKTSIFSYIIKSGEKQIGTALKISDFLPYIDLNYPNGDRYEFATKDALAADVRDLFDMSLNRRSRRISAVFLTETGEPKAKLVGMITPWDILKNANDARSGAGK